MISIIKKKNQKRNKKLKYPFCNLLIRSILQNSLKKESKVSRMELRMSLKMLNLQNRWNF